jgi:hypothetical protein
MQFVGLDERTRFTRRGGEAVIVDPGLYRVEVVDNEQIALIAEDGKATIVEAESGAHPLDLDAPFAVAFDAEGDRRLAVLLPGGVAVMAGSARTPVSEAQRQKVFGSPGHRGARSAAARIPGISCRRRQCA